MKKTFAAALLLLLLLAGTLLNIRYWDGFIAGLTEQTDAVHTSITAGDYAAAEKTLRHTLQQWDEAEGLTGILIRHSEIDSTTDAFYELLAALRDSDPGAAAACEKLRSHLSGIADMERLTWANVF